MKYNVRMAPAKKYRVKVRLKIRNRIFRNAGFALSSFAAAAVLAYCCFSAARFAAARFPGHFFAFTFKSLSVEAPSGEISAEISRRLDGKLGGTFSTGEAAEFAAGLKKNYPALSRVEVSRNFISGRVSVRAEAEKVVAKVRLNGGETFYLSENGRLLREYCGVGPEDSFETEIYAGPAAGLGPFAVFLRELKTMTPDFFSRPVRLEYRLPGAEGRSGTSPGSPAPAAPDPRIPRPPDGGYCRLTLENSALVLWGELGFTKSKISRLNEVLGDAARRINGPLKVDFRYFRDGKVFVSKLAGI
ncbi:MAG: hypothetical protein A2X28_06970 [Elusimicrobia bacterium GWA2_56_46]|nr:MAG: hypothetical protein A2X28_06970 [Elusimicrobia bacterium GWA2_56_46]OGR54810.1 MAG: hypothetical protein A2X39_11020 [Elusimicrobia bacterium GWC2_56_31]HBB66220.1 hypothetical protein [Elusimicrobiota bacterium]HBW23399.1 hypothetical protein [Elusimicrobiota bacterium]